MSIITQNYREQAAPVLCHSLQSGIQTCSKGHCGPDRRLFQHFQDLATLQRGRGWQHQPLIQKIPDSR